MIRWIRIILGWLLMVLGVAGLVLPMLQGWLFLGIGAVLLAPDVAVLGRMVCWIENRSPRLHRIIERMRRKLHRYGEAPPPDVQRKRDCK